jgi:hypothetical protein
MAQMAEMRGRAMGGMSSLSGSNGMVAGSGRGYGAGYGTASGGGIYRATDALQ